MENLRALIVGCGRLGTGYLANCLNISGANCGHEQIFTAFGIMPNANLEIESSWHAVPYLHLLKPEVKILHIVRQPQKVMESIYRIGLLAPSKLQHVSRGHVLKFFVEAAVKPKTAMNRFKYVQAHRAFLNANSNIFELATELERLNAYWFDWNTRIEQFSNTAPNPYMRIQLENIRENLEEIRDFFSLDELSLPNEKFNKKLDYKREISSPILPSLEVQTFAARYGY